MKLKSCFFPIFLFFSFCVSLSLFILLLFTDEDIKQLRNPIFSQNNISEEVLVHKPMVEKYAKKYNIEEHMPILLAIIQVESEGQLEDVMQSSESLNLPPNTLTTEESIEQGTKYFAQLVQSVEEQNLDIDTAIQAYNFGGSFINYVSTRNEGYSFQLAESFAKEQANGKKVAYSHAIAIKQNGGWRYSYGNMFYVPLVTQYLSFSSEKSNWIRPAEGIVTSPYGYRLHPIYGDWRMHKGIDIAGNGAILAARSGIITAASYNSGLGYFVTIDHQDGFESIYGHLQPHLLVSIGDKVQQGQRIGTMGTTGISTGVHLDFQIKKDGKHVDPAPYIGL